MTVGPAEYPEFCSNLSIIWVIVLRTPLSRDVPAVLLNQSNQSIKAPINNIDERGGKKPPLRVYGRKACSSARTSLTAVTLRCLLLFLGSAGIVQQTIVGFVSRFQRNGQQQNNLVFQKAFDPISLD